MYKHIACLACAQLPSDDSHTFHDGKSRSWPGLDVLYLNKTSFLFCKLRTFNDRPFIFKGLINTLSNFKDF